jgi:HAMP domain-containing protein
MVLVFSTAGAVALTLNAESDDQISQIEDKYWVGTSAVMDLRADVFALQGSAMCYVNDEAEALDEMAELQEGIESHIERIEASEMFAEDDVSDIEASIEEFNVTITGVVEAVDGGDASEIDEAVEAMDEKTFELNDELVEYVASAKTDLESNITDLHDMIQMVNIVLIASLVGVLVFGLAFSMLFARSLLGPITRMTSAANDISSGKKDVGFLNIDRADEIGELGKSFDRMINSLKVAMDMLEKDGKA